MKRRRSSVRQVTWFFATVVVLGSAHACSPDGPAGGLPTHPSDGFSVSLEWDSPTQDALGRPLTDLAGYRLYYSPSPLPAGSEVFRLDLGLDTRVTVAGLPAGPYSFAVTAVDHDGNESDLSAPLDVDVGP